MYENKTVTGDIVSFDCNTEHLLDECKIYFSPFQRGSGDPSPSNIRPIEGWTNIPYVHTNSKFILVEPLTPDFAVAASSDSTVDYLGNGIYAITNNDTSVISSVSFKIKPISIPSNNKMFLLVKIDPSTIINNQSAIRFKNSYPVSYVTTRIYNSTQNITGKISFGSNKNFEELSIISNLNGTPFLKLQIGIVIGEENLPLISWNEIGTIYGGHVDLIEGKLYNAYKMITYTGAEENWEESSSGYAIPIPSDISISGILYSNYLTTLPKGGISGLTNWQCRINSNGTHLLIKPDMSICSTLESWKTYLSENNLNVLFYLTDSISYNIDPVEIKTYIGQNSFWSGSNNTIKVTYRMENRPSQSLLAARRNNIIAAQPHLVTLSSSNIASFNTDIAAPLKSLRINFEPTQSGTGDPSPTNIRTIEGWTGLNIYKTGKNLLPSTLPANTIYGTLNGNIITSAGSAIIFAIPCSQNTNYCCSQDINNRKNWAIAFSNKLPEVGDTISGKGNMTYRSIFNVESENYTYLLVGIPNTDIFTGMQSNNSMIEVGNTNTAYALTADLTTLPINWTTEAEIVYGGYVDLMTGDVVATMNKFLIASTDWEYQSTVSSFYVELSDFPTIAKIATSENDFVGYCEKYKFYKYVTLVNDKKENGISVRVDGNAKRIYVRTDGTSSTNPGDVNVVLLLATPTTVATLTPEQINTLKGVNNIWSNANENITVQYWTH